MPDPARRCRRCRRWAWDCVCTRTEPRTLRNQERLMLRVRYPEGWMMGPWRA